MPVIDLNKIRTENHWTNRIKDKARNIGRTVTKKVKEGIDFVKRKSTNCCDFSCGWRNASWNSP